MMSCNIYFFVHVLFKRRETKRRHNKGMSMALGAFRFSALDWIYPVFLFFNIYPRTYFQSILLRTAYTVARLGGG